MSSSPAMTVDEVAAVLGISSKHVYEEAAQGRIPHRRIGRRVIFPRVAIERWLASAPAVQPAPVVARKPILPAGYAEPKDHLYAIAAPAVRAVKIGRARDVLKRFDALRTASPVPLEIVAWADWCGDLELTLHARYDEYRLNGEWFAEPVLRKIEDAIGKVCPAAAGVAFARWVTGHGAPAWRDALEASLEIP